MDIAINVNCIKIGGAINISITTDVQRGCIQFTCDGKVAGSSDVLVAISSDSFISFNSSNCCDIQSVDFTCGCSDTVQDVDFSSCSSDTAKDVQLSDCGCKVCAIEVKGTINSYISIAIRSTQISNPEQIRVNNNFGIRTIAVLDVQVTTRGNVACDDIDLRRGVSIQSQEVTTITINFQSFVLGSSSERRRSKCCSQFSSSFQCLDSCFDCGVIRDCRTSEGSEVCIFSSDT